MCFYRFLYFVFSDVVTTTLSLFPHAEGERWVIALWRFSGLIPLRVLCLIHGNHKIKSKFHSICMWHVSQKRASSNAMPMTPIAAPAIILSIPSFFICFFVCLLGLGSKYRRTMRPSTWFVLGSMSPFGLKGRR